MGYLQAVTPYNWRSLLRNSEGKGWSSNQKQRTVGFELEIYQFGNTVDGRNPANQLRLVFFALVTRFYTSQVVHDFFHQQYVCDFCDAWKTAGPLLLCISSMKPSKTLAVLLHPKSPSCHIKCAFLEVIHTSNECFWALHFPHLAVPYIFLVHQGSSLVP